MLKKLAGATVVSAISCSVVAQESEVVSTIESLHSLLGEWTLEVSYANGARASGERICAKALGGLYIRCDSQVTYDDDDATTRASVNFINYNEERDLFEEVTMWQFPAVKKIADLAGEPTGAGLAGDAIIHAGGDPEQTRRFYDTWTLEDDRIVISLKTGDESVDKESWPAFLTETMLRKR